MIFISSEVTDLRSDHPQPIADINRGRRREEAH
jgi:hypothetical protein